MSGNPRAVEFRFQQIKRKAKNESQRTQRDGEDKEETEAHPHFDFSFSGIKTAVLRYVQANAMGERVDARRRALGEALRANPALRPAEALREMPEVFDRQTLDLIASFQYAVVGNLMRQTFAAAEALARGGLWCRAACLPIAS